MTMPSPIQQSIPLVDLDTGQVRREWLRFFNSDAATSTESLSARISVLEAELRGTVVIQAPPQQVQPTTVFQTMAGASSLQKVFQR